MQSADSTLIWTCCLMIIWTWRALSVNSPPPTGQLWQRPHLQHWQPTRTAQIVTRVLWARDSEQGEQVHTDAPTDSILIFPIMLVHLKPFEDVKKNNGVIKIFYSTRFRYYQPRTQFRPWRRPAREGSLVCSNCLRWKASLFFRWSCRTWRCWIILMQSTPLSEHDNCPAVWKLLFLAINENVQNI